MCDVLLQFCPISIGVDVIFWWFANIGGKYEVREGYKEMEKVMVTEAYSSGQNEDLTAL